tara:strand:- start:322 stop:666 length:345 start_codon:yes stop_codon:yes gene_type:complete
MSKRTYKEDLESKGLSKDDGSYDVTYAIEQCHKAFTMLSDGQRLKVQNIWGVKFITELERFGRYTESQSKLVQEPSIMNAEPHPLDAEPDSSDEELKEADAYDDAEAYAERMHP